jgi:hypothetical protein
VLRTFKAALQQMLRTGHRRRPDALRCLLDDLDRRAREQNDNHGDILA